MEQLNAHRFTKVCDYISFNKIIIPDTEDRKIVKDYSPGPYKRGTSWSDWFRRLKSYFVVANETDEKRQRHIFLLEIGTDNYEILKRQFGGPLPEDQPINFLYWEMGVAIGQRALGYCSPSLQVK